MDLKMTSSSSSSSCSSSSSSSSCADEQRRRRRLDEQDNLDSSLCDVNNNNVCALNSTGTLPTIHIATWATVAPTLQAYADAYNQAHPQAPLLSLTILDSIRDLQTSTTSDLLQQQQDSPNLSFLYDGYVMPPLMVGPLVEQQGLLALDEFQEESFYSDILPYYRNLVAEFDGRIRSLPLFAGSQLVLLYRKDYLDLYDLDVPETWTDMELVASVIRNRTPLMGMCLGRLTEEGCRKRRQVTGEPCQSLSMSYLGMQLASMTQAQGNSSGWWLEERERLETEHSYGGRLEPLWNNTLEQVLSMMESQTSTQSESVEALQQDGQWNLEMFRKGMCAMTIVANHPADVLTRSSAVGFAPLPGSLQVLDRTTTTSAGTLQNCTTSSCPFGSDKDASSTGERYRYNRVPFGATDAVVGSVSAAAPPEHQQVVKDFLKFILTTTNVVDAPVFREQPFRYSQLEPLKSSNPAYADLIESLTTDESNAAIPFRIPEALTMWTELDTGVHDYLLADNYTQDNRQQFRIRMEETWERIMDQHDNHQGVDAVPLSIFYQQSLGTFTPAAASDLYIGQSFRVVGWTLGGIGMCLSITMACWVYYYRNKRVIRASQPMFLWMVCAGTLLMSSSIFPFGIEDDIVSDQGADMACMSGIWLYSLGFVTAFSALFSKIWRINRIVWRARSAEHVKMEPNDVLGPFFTILILNVTVLIVWNVVEPMQWERLPLDEDDVNDELHLVEADTYGACVGDHALVYFSVLVACNFVVSLTAIIQAYECRKVSTEYSESLWISGALFCIVQVWLIGLPVLRLLDDNPKAYFGVKTGIAFVTSISTLLLLFVPKMRYLRESLSEEAEEEAEEAKSDTADKKGMAGGFLVGKKTSEEDSSSVEIVNTGRGVVKMTSLGAIARPFGGARRARELSFQQRLGIRIIQHSIGDRSEEVHRMQKDVDRATERKRMLQERLEKLQEKLLRKAAAGHSR